jgi:hypothetical protein
MSLLFSSSSTRQVRRPVLREDKPFESIVIKAGTIVNNEETDDDDESDTATTIGDFLSKSSAGFSDEKIQIKAFFKHGGTFKNIVESLKTVNDSADFIFTPDSISCIKGDPENNVLFSINIDTDLIEYEFNFDGAGASSSDFDEHEDKIKMGFALVDFKGALSMVKKTTPITLVKYEGNKYLSIFIHISDDVPPRVHKILIKTLSSDEYNLESIVHDKITDNIVIRSDEFKDTFKSAKTMTLKSVTIIGYPSGMLVKGDIIDKDGTFEHPYGNFETGNYKKPESDVGVSDIHEGRKIINPKQKLSVVIVKKDDPIVDFRISTKICNILSTIPKLASTTKSTKALGINNYIGFSFQEEKPIRITCTIEGGIGQATVYIDNMNKNLPTLLYQ